MIVSSDFSNMNSTALRKISAKVSWFDASSTYIRTFNPDDYLQEITVTRVGEHGKFFGFGVCQQATVKIIDEAGTFDITKGQKITLLFNGNSEISSHYKYRPLMIIKEVTRDEKTRVITLKAYDPIDNATAYTFKDLNLEAPYKISDVVSAIVTKLGLSGYTIGSGFDTSYEKGANFSGDETLRVVLNAIAEATQSIYYVNHLDKLIFKTLSITGDPVLTIDKNNYFELTTGTKATLTKIVHATELGDNVYAGTDAGECQYVRDNPFWNTRDDLGVLLAAAINRVDGLTIIPFNIRWRGNFLAELGDKVSIETKDGTFINTFILDDSLSFKGGMTQTMSWEYNPDSDKTTAANPVTIGEKLNQTFARVDKIEKKITLQVSEVVNEIVPGKIDEALEEALGEGLEGMVDDIEDLKTKTSTNTQNISQLTVTSNGINQEVSSLKQSTTTLSNELDEVIATQNTLQEDVSSLQVSAGGISASVSSVEQKVTKVENDINNVANQTNERIDKVSSEVALKLDREAVEIEVNKRIEEGVDKVTTSSKKYTFDDEGLMISAPDSEFSTEVTDNGMKIYRHSSEVLTVDNQGVKAQDLHAYTFLIIGENSRMEDRGNRTACFWIGPAGG